MKEFRKLYDLLKQNQYLTDSNYHLYLANGLDARSVGICALVYPDISERLDASQSFYEKLTDLFSESESTLLNALELLPKVNNAKVRKQLSLKIAASFSSSQTWAILDQMITDGVSIEYSDIPTKLLCIPELSDLAYLKIYMRLVRRAKNMKTKKLQVYSLMKSIDNTYAHPASMAAVLSQIHFDIREILDPTIFSIMFHIVSHFGCKVVCFKLIYLMRQLSMTPSMQDYYYAMRTQCFGTESDLLIIHIIDCYQDHGEITDDARRLLMKVSVFVKDENLARLVHPGPGDVEKIKAEINYGALEQTFHIKSHRRAKKHPLIHGFGKYSKLRDHFSMKMAYRHIFTPEYYRAREKSIADAKSKQGVGGGRQ
ncbi:unnamed protein product [Ambrosiozyma monospora]|uniref:Unnamed protein product n=1 Tax=Ambrosiozyma monospora TaxID=43982 RepID=A0ACB5TB32_AMBMO|nr:unnamed protein product [Ambrosiozyma monospora]